MARERDVRNAIQASLLATGAFSDVWLTGLPEDYGQGASNITAAAIEPVATRQLGGWDSSPAGALELRADLAVTLLARHPDPQLRDELAEQLLDYLINAVNGSSLAGLTVPQCTLVTSWKWQSPKAPERRITATVEFTYLVAWNSFDTSP
ncbi:MAG: hypothetical protein ACYC61_15525 [Isosphaeraceae bacterium]